MPLNRFIRFWESWNRRWRWYNDDLAEITNKHFVSDAIIALAAEKKSLETFYLIRITKEYDTKDYDDTDDYGHRMKIGQRHLKDNFLREIVDQTKHIAWQKKLYFSLKRAMCIHSCNWRAQKRFYMTLWWIVADNTICWTFWFYSIVQNLINIDTKTIHHCPILH